ncbi:MAG: hypothetical protein J6A38_05185 [Clostridia bacterium]|nr:hypothetical protein [Clostridia bacterium]
MSTIQVDFKKQIGALKIMHAVGQPPTQQTFRKLIFDAFQYLTDAHIPYSRLHDVGGAFGGNLYVDIPNLFRDFDADENDPDAYDFTFTDELIKAMIDYKLEPIFRLGVTIENLFNYKAYRIHPPKDFAKWARICEHVIRHYNEGWANGFHFHITYWEIWNEPENGVFGDNQMWTGTDEQYYELYTVTSKHLKSCFGNSIKVGGYAASGFYGIYYHPEKYGVNVPTRPHDERYEKDMHRVDFLLGFLEYIKKENAPLDFFSWHSYSKPEKTRICCDWLHRTLEEYGYGDVETHLNEWNSNPGVEQVGSSYSSASAAEMFCVMHQSKVHSLYYYDAKITSGAYQGLFNAYTKKPVSTYYVFYAYGEMYTLKNQVECISSEERVYALAASNEDKQAVFITNVSGEDKTLEIPACKGMSVYVIDADNFLTKTEYDPTNFVLKNNQVAYIKNF